MYLYTHPQTGGPSTLRNWGCSLKYFPWNKKIHKEKTHRVRFRRNPKVFKYLLVCVFVGSTIHGKTFTQLTNLWPLTWSSTLPSYHHQVYISKGVHCILWTETNLLWGFLSFPLINITIFHYAGKFSLFSKFRFLSWSCLPLMVLCTNSVSEREKSLLVFLP